MVHNIGSVDIVLTSINELSSLKVPILEDRTTLDRTGSVAELQLNSRAMVTALLIYY